MSKKVYIFRNNKDFSRSVEDRVLKDIRDRGWTILEEFDENADLLICIGGDGTFLSFLHKCRFPKAPVMGINTGHLGFFQEVTPDSFVEFLDNFESGNYKLQKIRPVEARIYSEKATYTRIGVNEILIRGSFSHVSHFEVSIHKTKVQDFSGDGLLISTPQGSTAYNYSLDGALVSPDLDVLQITPVAPMNTNAYRCFHSSVLLPASETITVTGTGRCTNGLITLSFDGRTHEFNRVNHIDISQSEHEISLIRSINYDYWSKLSSKLL